MELTTMADEASQYELDDHDGLQCGAGAPLRLAVHGPGVEIDCAVPALRREIRRLLGVFAVDDLPAGFAPAVGTVQAYDPDTVARHLSPAATPLPLAGPAGEMADVFQDGERFWLVDDRWGMAEVNLLKGTWRSWVLPRPRLDPVRCAELAVLWPMAQLLRGRGVHLVPAASAERDGWGVLILCPFPAGPELAALVRAGYRLIGQRWTAVREDAGRLELLHMPGLAERPSAGASAALTPGAQQAWGRPVRRPGEAVATAPEPTMMCDADHRPGHTPDGHTPDGRAHNVPPGWVDLTADGTRPPPGVVAPVFCEMVVVADPGRRPQARLLEVSAADAAALLRGAWPIPELHPARRQGHLPARFARLCRCVQVQLSRDADDLPALLQSARPDPSADEDAAESTGAAACSGTASGWAA